MDPKQFAGKIRGIYGDELLAVVLYGSAALREDFSEKFSDVNLIVVLRDISPSEIAKSNALVRRWVKRGNPAPHFFNPKHIATSADVFPLEFMDIIDRHKVLVGSEDPFCDVKIELKNLRHQCESELKGKLVHLRSFFAANCNHPKRIAKAVIASWSGVRAALRGVIRLLNVDAPASPSALIEELASVIEFNPQVFFDVLAVRDGSEMLPRKEEAIRLFETYLTELDAITTFVDKFQA